MSTTPVDPAACPACGAAVPAGSRFCEECGRPVADAAAGPAAASTPVPDPASAGDPVAAPVEDLGSGPISAPTHRAPLGSPTPTGPRACLSCRGAVGAEGYCEVCGAKAASERDHFREAPAAWVAGVCDRGIVHRVNEDAMALLASPAPGERAVLVVLDGVSNTDDSEVASLAGARAAREVLRTPFPRGMGTPTSRAAAIGRVFEDAVKAANDAVLSVTDPASTNPASATFVAAVVERDLLAYANVGDSRAYWLPDAGPARQLTVDDSASQAQMEAGVAREVAETSPQAHAITKWLGRDSHDITPRVGQVEIVGPGWVVVCSDGLWNYASAADVLAAQLAAAETRDPAELALALTAFANARGGQDNITVALARVEAAPAGHNATEPHPETDQQGESDG